MPNENPPRESGCTATFEAALAQLEAIANELEDGTLGLADALARYEEAVRLLEHCHGLLKGAERRIELLSGVDAEGNPVTRPFAAEASLPLEEKPPPRARGGAKSGAGRKARPAVPDEARTDMDEPTGLF